MQDLNDLEDKLYPSDFSDEEKPDGQAKSHRCEAVLNKPNDAVTPHTLIDPSNIDPIVNAGGARINLLSKDSDWIPFFREALCLLNTSYPAPTLKHVIRSRIDPTTASLLVSSGVWELSNRGDIHHFLIAFVVAKSNKRNRLIGHPKMINEMSQSHPLSLLSVVQLIYLINNLSSLSQHIYATEMDFKNYFPQIPIGDQLKRDMGILVDGQFFRQRVLTQGWTHSTFIAQSITWAILLYHPTFEKDLYLSCEHFRSLQSPPSHYELKDGSGNVVGLILVVYDNILILSRLARLRDQWRSRLISNLKRFNIIEKYCKDTTDEFEFLGLCFRHNSAPSTLSWCTKPETFCGWQKRPYDALTARNVASIFGTLVRHTQISLKPLFTLRQHYPLICLVHQIMQGKQKAQWKSMTLSSEFQEGFTSLKHHLLSLQNTRIQFPPRTPVGTEVFYLVSDATPKRIGWIIFDHSFTILDAGSEPVISSSIDLGEADAVIAGLSSKLLAPTLLLILGIDNTVVGRAIVRGYSPSPELNVRIQKIHDLLSKFSQFIIVDIASLHNASDTLSRLTDTSNLTTLSLTLDACVVDRTYAQRLCDTKCILRYAKDTSCTGKHWVGRNEYSNLLGLSGKS